MICILILNNNAFIVEIYFNYNNFINIITIVDGERSGNVGYSTRPIVKCLFYFDLLQLRNITRKYGQEIFNIMHIFTN